MHRYAIITAALLLSGCASAKWAPTSSNVDPASFERTKAQCDYMARHGGQSPFYAEGNPNFVVGAASGQLITNLAGAQTPTTAARIAVPLFTLLNPPQKPLVTTKFLLESFRFLQYASRAR